MPCWVLKWNFTQWRSPAALTNEKVCEPKPCMKRGDWGMPRSENRIVTWCRLSGDSDQKSHMAVGERMLVFGWRFCVWMKSGNL